MRPDPRLERQGRRGRAGPDPQGGLRPPGQAGSLRCGQRREQPRHGSREALCGRGLCLPRAHHQAVPSRVQGPRPPHHEADFSHDRRGQRALKRRSRINGTESESPRPARGRHQRLGLPLVRP